MQGPTKPSKQQSIGQAHPTTKQTVKNPTAVRAGSWASKVVGSPPKSPEPTEETEQPETQRWAMDPATLIFGVTAVEAEAATEPLRQARMIKIASSGVALGTLT